MNANGDKKKTLFLQTASRLEFITNRLVFW